MEEFKDLTMGATLRGNTSQNSHETSIVELQAGRPTRPDPGLIDQGLANIKSNR